MKIIVSKKIEGGENVKFAVELPEEFNRYKPEFLREHFEHFILSAVVDLRAPEHLPLAIQLNQQWFSMKCGLFGKISQGVDLESLKKAMEKVNLDFIMPEGKSPENWKIKKGE